MTPKEIRLHMAQLKRNGEAIQRRLKKQEKQQRRKDVLLAVVSILCGILFLGAGIYMAVQTGQAIINTIPAMSNGDQPSLPWWMVD